MNSHPHLLLFLGSGLGYYTRQHGIARHSFVSIPFHSGLGYYLLRSVKVNELERLNPFSFRAGVLLHPAGNWARPAQVSIPFHSGLGYYIFSK